MTDSPNQFAYIAGFIDGEGSIMIRKSKPSNGRVNYAYSARVGVKNTKEAPLKLLKEVFGGHYHKDKVVYQSKSAGWVSWNPVYAYNAEHKIALLIIKKLAPYLLIKKQQAILAIKLEGRQGDYRSWTDTKYGRRRSNWYLSEAEKIYQDVKKLNARGPIGQVVLP